MPDKRDEEEISDSSDKDTSMGSVSKQKMFLQVAAVCILLQVPSVSTCVINGSVANCAFSRLRSVPALPPHITHLYLEMNKISEISAASFSNLSMLQQIDLGMQKAPLVIRNNAFSNQTNLTKLVLSSNWYLRLEPQAFVGLSNLKTLDLGYCSLNESILKESFLEPLTSLETLNLGGNKIKTFQVAKHFIKMTNLKDLNLKLNPINQICEAGLSGLKGKHFRFLNLNSVPLGDMSIDKFDWKKCGNPFKDMSFETIDSSGNMMNLKNLKQFLNAIQGTKINTLKISGYYGSGFPFNNLPDPDITTFNGLKNSSLQVLDLSKNQIFQIRPAVFHPFKDLITLDMSQNKVNKIDRNAFEGLGVLQSLNLSHNLLGEIYPETLAFLTSLKILDLSHNHIGALGFNSFSGLQNLRELYLSDNSLRTIGFPATLPRLQILKLDYNKLNTVYGIAPIANETTYLDVSNNRLTNLGDVYLFLRELKNLQYLSFSDNPVERCIADSRIGPNKLEHLYLDRISLQSVWSKRICLNLFNNLGNLQVLSLASNGLQTLPSGIFDNLPSLQQLDLASNALTNLQPNVLPQNLQVLNTKKQLQSQTSARCL